jgi:hypothetical protein
MVLTGGKELLDARSYQSATDKKCFYDDHVQRVSWVVCVCGWLGQVMYTFSSSYFI